MHKIPLIQNFKDFNNGDKDPLLPQLKRRIGTKLQIYLMCYHPKFWVQNGNAGKSLAKLWRQQVEEHQVVNMFTIQFKTMICIMGKKYTNAY